MNNKGEFLQAREWREGRGDFGFGIFSRSLERSDVAIAQAGPIGAVEFSRLAMKVREAETFAKLRRFFMRFVIAWQNPGAFSKLNHRFTAAFEPFAEI